MEILNNLWMALSTPNEGLVNILVSLATFLENYLIASLSVSILNMKVSKKQKLIYVICSSLIGMISMRLLPNQLNIFFNYFIMIMCFYLIFKTTFFRSVLSIVFSGIIFYIIGSLILNPFLTLFNIALDEFSTTPIYRLLYLALIYILIAFIILATKHRKLKISFVDDIDRKSKIIISLNLVLGIVTIFVQSIIALYYVDILPIAITFLNFLCLLSYFILNVYSLTRIFKLTLTRRKLESAEEYNNTLRILHDSVRCFKHDFDNIVTTIGGYINTNDMAGLKDYYVQLEDDCQRVNNLYVLNPDIVNNDGIYNLLTKKYHEATSKDIKVNITFLLDLSTLHMKIYEFARILGILLDNAIEAATECDTKIINLTFRNDFKNHTQLVIIENSYKDKDINTEKIFEKGVSGKENHTGLGLWEVRKLAKKNNNVNLLTSKTDELFTQQLEIYYK